MLLPVQRLDALVPDPMSRVGHIDEVPLACQPHVRQIEPLLP